MVLQKNFTQSRNSILIREEFFSVSQCRFNEALEMQHQIHSSAEAKLRSASTDGTK